MLSSDVLDKIQLSHISKRQTLLVGVSGGPDSVALLDVLHRAGIHRLQICHLNHCLRGAASDGDEQFVRRLAQKYRLPCHVARADVRSLAKTHSLSLEEAAREARLEFFAATARKLKLQRPIVALAHHADDQVETFLLRLLRGAGARGLGAMRPRTPFGSSIILRPLLGVWRSEILEYVRERKLKYRTDATNCDTSLLRNRIRHKLLPLLARDYNPGIREVLWRTAEILGEEDALLDAATFRAIKSGKSLKSLPMALQRRAMRMCNPGATFGEVEQQLLRHSRGKTPAMPPKKFRSYTIKASINPKPKTFHPASSIQHPASKAEYFDADLVGRWTIRYWRPGDRMQPLGMKSTKKLQDLFTDAKVPVAVRGRIPVVVAENGTIAWVVGVRMSDEFKVTSRTRRLLRLNAKSTGRSIALRRVL